MFALDLSDETTAVVELCRALAKDVLAPAARDADRSGTFPENVRRSLFETGLTVPVAESYGGGGIPAFTTQLAAIEELAAGDPGLTMRSVWAGSGASFIDSLGDEPTRRAHLESFATNPSAVLPVALFEGFGRAPSESQTTITAASDGTCSVSGTKLAVADAKNATAFVVIGRTPDGALRAALVPASANTTVTNSGRIGLAPSQLSEVQFEHATGTLLGSASNEDRATLDIAITRHRLLSAAALLGTARRAIEYASAYANERIAFGKPIAAFQGVSFLLAENAIRIASARLEAHDVAARALDRSSTTDLELESATTAAVNYVGAVATEATRDAIQVLGGHGFITDHPVELWYRSAAAISVIDCDPLLAPFAAAF